MMTGEPLYPALERAPGFAALDAAARRAVLATLERRHVPAGAPALHPGEDRRMGLLVCSGALAVREHGADEPAMDAGPGTLVGIEQLLTDTAPALRATATVPSEVLVLTRVALPASPAGRLLGRELVEALRLRLPPRPLPGCRVIRPSRAIEAPAPGLLAHPWRGAYRLSTLGLFLWELLDGRRTYRDLVLLYRERTGVVALEPVAQTLRGLAKAGYLAALPLAPGLEAALFPRTWLQRLGGGLRRGATWRRTGTAPVAALNLLYRRGGWWLCTRPALALQTAIAGAGLLHAACGDATPPEGPSRLPARLFLPAGTLLVHELGHAMATLHTGHPVLGLGFGMHRLIPIIFVDTTALWLGSPRDRLVVSLAGVWANLLLSGTLLLGARLVPRYAAPLVAGARTSYRWSLVAVQPLSLDGQHALAALSEWAGVPGERRATARRPLFNRGVAIALQVGMGVLAARHRAARGRGHG